MYEVVRKQETVDPAVCSSDTLFDSTVTVHPIYVDYEEELRQHRPLLESNTYCERLRYSFTETDTNVLAGIQ